MKLKTQLSSGQSSQAAEGNKKVRVDWRQSKGKMLIRADFIVIRRAPWFQLDWKSFHCKHQWYFLSFQGQLSCYGDGSLQAQASHQQVRHVSAKGYCTNYRRTHLSCNINLVRSRILKDMMLNNNAISIIFR